MNASKKVLILGSTGLVGRELLKLLLNEPAYPEIRALVRAKPGGTPSGGKLEVRKVDFEHLDVSMFSGCDHVFCCLGTTIKQAGSRENFRRIDQEYVVRSARLSAQAGARKFLLISSVGADAQARTFYLKVKGETEAAVGKSGVPEVHLFRPSFLLGERDGSRPLERLGISLLKPVMPLLTGSARRYRPIESTELAQGMLLQALRDDRAGVWVHEGAALNGR